MHAGLVVFFVFLGLSLFAGVVMGGIMLATGRLTLPGSPEARLKNAQTDLAVAQIAMQTERAKAQLDALVNTRHQQATLEQGKEQQDGAVEEVEAPRLP